MALFGNSFDDLKAKTQVEQSVNDHLNKTFEITDTKKPGVIRYTYEFVVWLFFVTLGFGGFIGATAMIVSIVDKM